MRPQAISLHAPVVRFPAAIGLIRSTELTLQHPCWLIMARTRATAAKSKAMPRPRGRASSSGHADSRTSSPSASQSPRNVVGRYSLDTLPASWDNDPTVRDRMRSELPLVVRVDEKGDPVEGYVEATKDSIKMNSSALLPLCQIMRENHLMLPSIDQLILALDKFYQMVKLSRSLEFCYHQAWAFRRLLVKLKHVLYRDFPPQDLVPQMFKRIYKQDMCF